MSEMATKLADVASESTQMNNLTRDLIAASGTIYAQNARIEALLHHGGTVEEQARQWRGDWERLESLLANANKKIAEMTQAHDGKIAEMTQAHDEKVAVMGLEKVGLETKVRTLETELGGV